MKKVQSELHRAWTWLQSDAGMLLAMLVCLPLGLVLVWRNQRFTAGFKKAFVGLGVVVWVLGLSFSMGHIMLKAHDQTVSAQSEQNHQHYLDQKAAYRTKADALAKLQADSDAYHSKMKPYEQLAAAEGKKRQADAAAAKKVTDALDALPDADDMSLDDKAQVQAVRKQFNLLSKNQKTLVDETTLKADEAKLVELAKEAAAKAAEAKRQQAAQAAAAKQKAEEEARGYDTGITYDQLARTPDSYEGKKVKFYGEVAQVMEDDGTIQARLAVNGDYDNMILCEWSSSTVTSRVLEDDMITVSGVSAGLLTYESTMGGDITIPSMSVDKIDQ